MTYSRFISSILLSIILIASAVAERLRIPLHEATIFDIQKAFDQGTLTSEELVGMYLKRIEKYDQQGPALNSILTLNEEAITEARKLDIERSKTGPRSLLHGIPIIPKDNFDTADMPTTGGFKGLKDSIPVRDAFTIRRLRESGAIILAKSNLDEFNSGSSGTSGLGGQVLNPYNLSKVPGGSSAGSGAAIAAVFGQVGLGTETGSSIRNPSTKNNLVGIASTNGLVSRAGIVPSSIILDRAGPMARSVTDAAIVLQYMAGMDAADLTTIASVGKMPVNGYHSFLDVDALKGSRIGVLRANFGSDPEDAEALSQIDKAIDSLAEGGATLLDPIPVGSIDMFEMLRTVSGSSGERAEAMNHYLAGRGPDVPVKTMQEIVGSGLALGKLQERLDESLREAPMYRNPDYANFVRNREAFKKLVISWFKNYELDAIIYPYQTKPVYTIEQAAPNQGETRSEFNNYDVMGRGTRMSTATGFPGITVPAGFTASDGMPVGLEFLGRPFDEGKLIGICFAYEQGFSMRKLPSITPPLEAEWIEFDK